MSLFDLPLSNSVKATTSRLHSSLPPRKRKRRRSSSPPSFEIPDPYADSLHVASTNPLSLTPNEIAQYRIAGLSLNEELPDRDGVRDWPHRGLPRKEGFFTPTPKRKSDVTKENGRAAHEGNDEGNEEREDQHETLMAQRAPRGHTLRIQHLSTLAAILHRNLLDGDILRATRAYSLMLRMDIGGKPMDITSTGYWAIGAELLVRCLDHKRKRSIFQHTPNSDSDSNSELDEGPLQEEENAASEARAADAEKRWGSAIGLSKAKSFYETLIGQYPYYRQYHGYFNYSHIWPHMTACEIYGIQYEQRAALRKIKLTSTAGYSSQEEAHNESDALITNEEDYPRSKRRSSQLHRTRRRQKKKDQVWVHKDSIRLKALAAAEELAERVDGMLSSVMFDSNQDMLRLRGMLALYIGDLSVPEMPAALEGDEARKRADISSDEENLKRELDPKNILDRRRRDREDEERRFLFRQRAHAHESGKETKRQEWSKAKVLFEEVQRKGGRAMDLGAPDEVMDEDTSENQGQGETENLYDASD